MSKNKFDHYELVVLSKSKQTLNDLLTQTSVNLNDCDILDITARCEHGENIESEDFCRDCRE